MTEIKNTNEIKFSTKYSTSYKHSISYWYFCNCFKDYSNSGGISGKNLCIKYLKPQIDRDKLIKRLKIVKQLNLSSICDSILSTNTYLK